jgi:hypothetical protein
VGGAEKSTIPLMFVTGTAGVAVAAQMASATGAVRCRLCGDGVEFVWRCTLLPIGTTQTSAPMRNLRRSPPVMSGFARP